MNEPAGPTTASATTVADRTAPDGAAGGGSAPSPGPDEWVSLLHRAAADSLGLDVVYDLLALVAQRFGLDDLTVVVTNEVLGTQAFRLGRRPIGSADLALLEEGTGFTSTPKEVPAGAQRLVLGLVEVALATHLAQRKLVRDPATGLLSRAVFNEALRAAAAQSSRYGWTFTVLVLRIGTADARPSERETRRLGHAFARALRSGDTGGRLYRETFTALLPNATAESLHALVQRFREESGLDERAARYASATAPNDSVDPAELLRLAGSRLNGGA
jgi:GGDEF domain-containing protein